MKKDIVLYYLLKSPWHFLPCIAIITSLQLLPLFFAQRKAKTRREKLKAVSAIMTFQFNWMEIPVFCRISTGIHPPADQLLPHLLASSRESPTGDLDPLCSAINLRILYGTEKRFKKMFDCLGGLAMTRIVFNSLRDVLSPLLNVSQESQPRAKCLGKSKTWSCPVLFCYGWDSLNFVSSWNRWDSFNLELGNRIRRTRHDSLHCCRWKHWRAPMVQFCAQLN